MLSWSAVPPVACTVPRSAAQAAAVAFWVASKSHAGSSAARFAAAPADETRERPIWISTGAPLLTSKSRSKPTPVPVVLVPAAGAAPLDHTSAAVHGARVRP